MRFLRPVLLLSYLSLAQTDPRIPGEVRYKSGYINPVPKPPEFTSAMLWGIAIADTRVPGYRNARVEIAHTQLACRVDGRRIELNDDAGKIRGGLYSRHPWFATDAHDPIPLAYSTDKKAAVILRVGQRPNRVWHFWSASPRASLPTSHFEGCTVKPVYEFLVAPCCKWEWTTGEIPRSDTVLAATITKRERVIGTFLQASGRRRCSRTSSEWAKRPPGQGIRGYTTRVGADALVCPALANSEASALIRQLRPRPSSL